MAKSLERRRQWRGLISWLVFLCFNTVLWWESDGRKAVKRKDVSILDVGCGKHSSLAYIINRRKLDAVGLDIFEPYLKEAKDKGVYPQVVVGDARWLPFRDKSFDVVTCMEVIEHVEKEDGEKILNELERVSKWLVLISTPIGECRQYAYDQNPFQEHRSTWSVQDLRTRGFKIRGRGLRGMSGDRWWQMFPHFLRPLQYTIEIIVTLFSYFFPKVAASAVAWKEREPSQVL